MVLLRDKKFIRFVVKFLLLFCAFYFGTLAVIGLAAPGRLYSPFIENYFDYVSWIKQSLLWSVGIISGWLGYETYTLPDYIIRVKTGGGVKIAMDCVGYGVYSFWAAYVIANDGRWVKKVLWVTGGLLLLWLVNSLRISLVLIAYHEKKPMPFGIDHHSWFNIVAYAFIFLMIWLYERKGSRLGS
ncbi:MAG: exosortase/archaeosortase family protein [Rhizobacter sp.]|nr:exosortase/archaeosortase family protein [Ferruginibacter sp.]